MTVINGRAKITDSHTVSFDDKSCSCERILIATGGWPFVPDFSGNQHVITSNEIFDLDTFPERILVVGGGYIALEFAGIFAGLGAETTLSYRGEIPLKQFDHDLRDHVYEECSRHINMLMNSNVSEIELAENGKKTVRFKEGNELTVDCVLYATGRVPNTEGLGLENTTVQQSRNGSIVVNDYYQTHEPSIYALGDVIGRIALTPVAIAEGMTLAKHLYKNSNDTLDYDNIPTAVFSHPNVGTVGLTEQQARERFAEVQVYESDFRHLRHTISGNPERTYMKILVDADTDKVLGIHMMGDYAGEIIQGFAAALQCGITKSQLDRTVGIHPTAAEEFVTMREPRLAQ